MAKHLDVDRMYREHGHVVLRRAHSILGDESAARDVLQEVFVSLLDRPEQYRGDSGITTFLYRMTTNMCLNKLRNARSRTRLLETEGKSRSGATDGDPAARVAVRALLTRLPENLARVAVHYYVDEMTQNEIAQMVGCSRRNVGKLLDKLQIELRAEAA